MGKNLFLKKAVADTGLTFEQLGAKWGCDKSHISKWINMGITPHAKTAKKVADYFGEKVSDVFPETKECEEGIVELTEARITIGRMEVENAVLRARVEEKDAQISSLQKNMALLYSDLERRSSNIGEMIRAFGSSDFPGAVASDVLEKFSKAYPRLQETETPGQRPVKRT